MPTRLIPLSPTWSTDVLVDRYVNTELQQYRQWYYRNFILPPLENTDVPLAGCDPTFDYEAGHPATSPIQAHWNVPTTSPLSATKYDSAYGAWAGGPA